MDTVARARGEVVHTPGITGMWPAPPGAHMGHHGHSQGPTWGHHTHAITTTRRSRLYFVQTGEGRLLREKVLLLINTRQG